MQGLLSRLAEGERVAFDDLIRAELTALGALGADGQGPQVALDGPPGVRLRSGTVQTFALALHELATNALRHGALSTPCGRVAVSCGPDPAEGGAQRLEWAERNGPPIPAPPARKGFGLRLLERGLAGQAGMEAETVFEPGGLRCALRLRTVAV